MRSMKNDLADALIPVFWARDHIPRHREFHKSGKVRCLGCDTHQTVALDIVRRSKATPIHELERYMRCKDCSQLRGPPYKRSNPCSACSVPVHGSASPS